MMFYLKNLTDVVFMHLYTQVLNMLLKFFLDYLCFFLYYNIMLNIYFSYFPQQQWLTVMSSSNANSGNTPQFRILKRPKDANDSQLNGNARQRK